MPLCLMMKPGRIILRVWFSHASVAFGVLFVIISLLMQ
jgi:hypothetical protein